MEEGPEGESVNHRQISSPQREGGGGEVKRWILDALHHTHTPSESVGATRNCGKAPHRTLKPVACEDDLLWKWRPPPPFQYTGVR